MWTVAIDSIMALAPRLCPVRQLGDSAGLVLVNQPSHSAKNLIVPILSCPGPRLQSSPSKIDTKLLHNNFKPPFPLFPAKPARPNMKPLSPSVNVKPWNSQR
jgi:hypothetical protein